MCYNGARALGHPGQITKHAANARHAARALRFAPGKPIIFRSNVLGPWLLRAARGRARLGILKLATDSGYVEQAMQADKGWGGGGTRVVGWAGTSRWAASGMVRDRGSGLVVRGSCKHWLSSERVCASQRG